MKRSTIAILCLLAVLIASHASFAEPSQVALQIDAVGVKKLIVRSALATVATKVSRTREPILALGARRMAVPRATIPPIRTGRKRNQRTGS